MQFSIIVIQIFKRAQTDAMVYGSPLFNVKQTQVPTLQAVAISKNLLKTRNGNTIVFGMKIKCILYQ